jgi:DedD protein
MGMSAAREPEIYKDKVEVTLDGRQIFYLFFGGSVIIGLVFVLGVMVGRRVEARGHLDQARTQGGSDPLAALDKLESSDKASFGFRTVLAKPTAPAAAPATPVAATPVDHEIEKRAEARKAKAEKERSEKSDKKKVDREKSEKTAAEKSEKSAEKSEKSEKSAEKPERDRSIKAEGKGEGKSEEPRARFTLQLSSFQDKTEADAFLSQVKSAGFQPYLTEAEVSGKSYYRVRVGSYRSLEAATEAKSDVEKAIKKNATVMRL